MSVVQGSKDPGIQGYLFKRGQNAFRTWNRRWFYLSDNKLCYSKRNGEDVTVIEEDLRICLVRPLTDVDRRCCTVDSVQLKYSVINYLGHPLTAIVSL